MARMLSRCVLFAAGARPRRALAARSDSRRSQKNGENGASERRRAQRGKDGIRNNCVRSVVERFTPRRTGVTVRRSGLRLKRCGAQGP